RALEEASAGQRLEYSQTLGQRRLADVQPPRRTPQAAEVDCGAEGAQLRQLRSTHGLGHRLLPDRSEAASTRSPTLSQRPPHELARASWCCVVGRTVVGRTHHVPAPGRDPSGPAAIGHTAVARTAPPPPAVRGRAPPAADRLSHPSGIAGGSARRRAAGSSRYLNAHPGSPVPSLAANRSQAPSSPVW